jgi:hypothetical protein
MKAAFSSTGTNRFEVTLEKSNKNFSKKIQQVYMWKRHIFKRLIKKGA